jgi:hypothetical protein
MAAGANAIKDKITALSKDVNGPDPDTSAKNLNAALDDIDSLHDWTVKNKLFYAFDLYYWCSTFYLPQLYAQSANGELSASISRSLKKLTCIFGILENGQQNTNGQSFQEAFNNLIQIFQMPSIIPQFVDADGVSEDCDSLMKEMLQKFFDDNIGSSDPNVVAEAQRAQQMASDD